MAPRIAYLDLDGTLTLGGSMFHGAGGLTLAGARAIHALHEAGVIIVPASGRTVVQLREVARLLGSRDFIAELGSVIVRDKEESPTYDAGRWQGTHSEVGRRVTDALCKALPVAPYEPWFSMRSHTVLLRGPPGLEADLRRAASEAAPGLTAIDNGDVEPGVHAYHVLPEEVSKEHAVRQDLRERGLGPEDAVAFGDSNGDRLLAKAVGTMYHIGGPDGERIVGIPTRYADGLEMAVRLCLSR